MGGLRGRLRLGGKPGSMLNGARAVASTRRDRVVPGASASGVWLASAFSCARAAWHFDQHSPLRSLRRSHARGVPVWVGAPMATSGDTPAQGSHLLFVVFTTNCIDLACGFALSCGMEKSLLELLDHHKVVPEVKEALTDIDCMSVRALDDRFATEAALTKFFSVKLVEAKKLKIGKDELDWCSELCSLRNAWRQVTSSRAASDKAAAGGATQALGQRSKVDKAKRKAMAEALEAEHPALFWGSERTAPSSELLARCLDMAPGGRDHPGAYLAPELCISFEEEEEQARVKRVKREKVSPCRWACHLVAVVRHDVFVRTRRQRSP